MKLFNGVMAKINEFFRAVRVFNRMRKLECGLKALMEAVDIVGDKAAKSFDQESRNLRMIQSVDFSLSSKLRKLELSSNEMLGIMAEVVAWKDKQSKVKKQKLKK